MESLGCQTNLLAWCQILPFQKATEKENNILNYRCERKIYLWRPLKYQNDRSGSKMFPVARAQLRLVFGAGMGSYWFPRAVRNCLLPLLFLVYQRARIINGKSDGPIEYPALERFIPARLFGFAFFLKSESWDVYVLGLSQNGVSNKGEEFTGTLRNPISHALVNLPILFYGSQPRWH